MSWVMTDELSEHASDCLLVKRYVTRPVSWIIDGTFVYLVGVACLGYPGPGISVPVLLAISGGGILSSWLALGWLERRDWKRKVQGWRDRRTQPAGD